jgi:hypothetical protein
MQTAQPHQALFSSIFSAQIVHSPTCHHLLKPPNSSLDDPKVEELMRRLLARLIQALLPRRAAHCALFPREHPTAIPAATRLKTSDTTRLARRSHKPRLMAVDPDPKVLNFISDIASPWYHVIGARDPAWAKAWLMQHPDIVACVAGEKLSTANGVALLDQCRGHQPSMLRVLVTGNIDAAGPVKALLGGIAHRLVESPMCRENLGSAIDPSHLRASSITITRRPKLLAA